MKTKKQTEVLVDGELFFHSRNWLQMLGMFCFLLIPFGFYAFENPRHQITWAIMAVLYFAGGILLIRHRKKKLVQEQGKGSEQVKKDAL